MQTPKNKVGALFLCFVFGPLGLFYINKRAGIILSVVMLATIFAGMVAIGVHSSAHPLSPEDLELVMSGKLPQGQSGLTTILYIYIAAIVAEWLASMAWALITPTIKA